MRFLESEVSLHRNAWLIRNLLPLGPCSRPMPRGLESPMVGLEGVLFSCGRGAPVLSSLNGALSQEYRFLVLKIRVGGRFDHQIRFKNQIVV